MKQEGQAVSYTHLDVYKRQLRERFARPIADKLMDSAKEQYGRDLRKSTQNMLERKIQETTDTDVYKRQPIFKLGISKEAIVEFTKNTPELAGKFKYSEDGTQIRLDTKKSKIAFLKLMNDAFLHSELTQQWYDASAKDNITQEVG